MSVKLKITVTKEILEKSKDCGYANVTGCAIALAVRTVFPNAQVSGGYIDTALLEDYQGSKIYLPEDISTWITKFDNSNPEERVAMDPISFEVNISDKIINQINIDELKPLLQNHPTLELIEA